MHDINSNGTIDIEDFLSILGLFADVDVDGDGVWDSQDDCLDATACNYLASPTEPCAFLDAIGECGGACEGDGDGDGICDNLDTCDGDLDECGICNGPGPTEVVIDDITILYDSVYAEQIDEWWVFEIGADTTYSYECVTLPCVSPMSYQGYDYTTVLIGGQCWFAENLRSQLYLNGDSIPSNISSEEWMNTVQGAVAVYGEASDDCPGYAQWTENACDESWSLNEHGRLYNWYAVDDVRGLCPSGWHVPSDEECSTLIEFLGDGFDARDALTSPNGWTDYGCCGGGSNSSGFSLLPAGVRSGYSNTRFGGAGYSGSWWTASINGNEPWYRLVNTESDIVYRSHGEKRYGRPVRCLKDSE